jgi:hypothetical protein
MASKRRPKGRPPRRRHKHDLAQAFDWLVPDGAIFAGLPLHGNTRWLPRALVCLALLWAWSESKNLTDAFAGAQRSCDTLGHKRTPRTYQGFLGALARWSGTLIAILLAVLRRHMEDIGGPSWRVDGWLPIAFDGSRATAPRTKANERAFCAARYGQGQTAKYRRKKTKGMRRQKNERQKPQPPAPQVWVTLLWHMGLRLPWDWRLGPSDASERGHATDMVRAGRAPERTLFCGDAGFVGYDFWRAIRQGGGHFLVRVGGNVRLLAETADYKRLGDGRVLCWPKGQMNAGRPPLELRLVTVRLSKKEKMFLLTSVRDAERLTAAQAARLYRLRWGVEVEFRGLKQTLGRAKLRCRNDRRVLAELGWSLLGQAAAELLACKAQSERRAEKAQAPGAEAAQGSAGAGPARRSLAQTMRALRHCLRYPDEVPGAGQDLQSRLAEAMTDGYQRQSSKKARYRPPNPDKKPLGEPKISKPDAEQRQKLRETAEKCAA